MWSPPGEISGEGCWVIVGESHLYIAGTWLGVVWLAVTEWCHDRHLVG